MGFGLFLGEIARKDHFAHDQGTIDAARDSMKNAYGVAKETAEDVRTAVVDKGTIAVRSAGRYVDGNPWIAVGAAALIGMAVGMLMRRR